MKAKTRRRRTAVEARQEILDAAERALARGGPDSIRLLDIAREVGVSHPTVLHHFGSREGLVEAVVERAILKLEEDLKVTVGGAADAWLDPMALFNQVTDAFERRGQARLLAWLVLTGREPFAEGPSASNWSAIAQATHAMRLKLRSAEDGPPPTYEDTLFSVILSCLALFGDALIGEAVFHNAGLAGDAGARSRFRQWLGALLLTHLAR